ncbi:hypothetical protein PUNSTDRAFT_55110 [Punctularia strigosozonata HHB-11173 SS5]|uniref:BAG domain-containing protein n=1 Tax=Punctularia strigosozonata (strain HHB-11173) TaxID=741275 RepID=R7S5X2_PUNST|nr:uncharacterized protein PUNSTDRAFT_55110 [Punctularia strigosozonata HHB-11173 SS5]EIN05211.1 hypothetical protein PUNSTDRAFT_55110 [Punctularia strigosozonata HHB-11173 SS5]
MLAFVPATPVHQQHVLFRTSGLGDNNDGYGYSHRAPTSAYSRHAYGYHTTLAEHDYLLARARREALERQQAQAYHRQRQRRHQQELLALFAADLAEELSRARIRKQQEEDARRQQEELLVLRQRWQRRRLQEIAWRRQHALAEAEQRHRQEDLARFEQARLRQQQVELSKVIEALFVHSEPEREQQVSLLAIWAYTMGNLIHALLQPVSAPCATHAEVPRAPVDVKGKGKTKEEPNSAPSSDSASRDSVEDLLLQRAQVENDQEVQEALATLLRSLFTGSAPAQAQAPKERKNVRFDVNEQVGPSNSSAEPATFYQGEPATAALDPSPSAPGTSSLERKPALAGASAEQVRAHRHQRTSSLDEIVNIRASFDSLSSDFHLPEHLDFSPSPTASRSPSPVSNQPGESEGEEPLAYTANNRPLHQYTHALGLLLARLDAVESDGDEGVRRARKEAVVVVEHELERVEREVERQRPGSPAPTEDIADAKKEVALEGTAADQEASAADTHAGIPSISSEASGQPIAASQQVAETLLSPEDAPAHAAQTAVVPVDDAESIPAPRTTSPVPPNVDLVGTVTDASESSDAPAELLDRNEHANSPAEQAAELSYQGSFPESHSQDSTSTLSSQPELAASVRTSRDDDVPVTLTEGAFQPEEATSSDAPSSEAPRPAADATSRPGEPATAVSDPSASSAVSDDLGTHDHAEAPPSPIDSNVSAPSAFTSDAEGEEDAAVVIGHAEVPPASDANDHSGDDYDGWSDVENHL